MNSDAIENPSDRTLGGIVERERREDAGHEQRRERR